MLLDNYFNFFKNGIFICLFISTISYWFSLRFTNFKVFYTLAKISSRISTSVIFLLLSSRWLQHGYFPLSNLYESLLFLSCLLLFAHQILEYETQSKFFGATLIPIILFITSFGDLTLPLEMQKASALVPALQSNWLMMHVSLMMLSYAILLLGSLCSVIFLIIFLPVTMNWYIYIGMEKNYFDNPENYKKPQIEQYKLRQKRFPDDTLFSPGKQLLLLLDNWSYRTISLGFPFLTIGIISGAIWANEAWGSYWSWDPKETWALITWLVFAAYLHVRLIVGWAGKGPAALASVGFFTVWICYLGVNFLGQGLHSYGWLS